MLSAQLFRGRFWPRDNQRKVVGTWLALHTGVHARHPCRSQCRTILKQDQYGQTLARWRPRIEHTCRLDKRCTQHGFARTALAYYSYLIVAQLGYRCFEPARAGPAPAIRGSHTDLSLPGTGYDGRLRTRMARKRASRTSYRSAAAR